MKEWPPQFRTDLPGLIEDIVAYSGGPRLAVRFLQHIALEAERSGPSIPATKETTFHIDCRQILRFALTSPDEWLGIANEVRAIYEDNLKRDPRHPSWNELEDEGRDLHQNQQRAAERRP